MKIAADPEEPRILEENELGKLENVEAACAKLRDQFMAILSVNYKDVSKVSNSSTNILKYITMMHDHVSALVANLRQLQSVVQYLVDGNSDGFGVRGRKAPSPAASSRPSSTKLLQDRVEAVIVNLAALLFEHLPSMFELTIHDFSLIFASAVDLLAELARWQAHDSSSQARHSANVFSEKLLSWKSACLEGFFGSTTMVMVMHELHVDWSSHGMYQRNKRFSAGLIAYLSTVKSMIYSISEHCKRDWSESNAAARLQYSIPLLLNVINHSMEDVVRLYTADITPSRVRLWQFKADVVYSIMNFMVMLQCVKDCVHVLGSSRISLDGSSLKLCNRMRLTMRYLLWYLHVLYTPNAEELLRYIANELLSLQPVCSVQHPPKTADLSELFDDMDNLLRTHTNLFDALQAFLQPLRGAVNTIESANSGDICYNYSADVTCMLGLAQDVDVDHSKSSEGNGYISLQAKLIDIVNAFVHSNPLTGDCKTTMVDLLIHASNLSQSITSLDSGGGGGWSNPSTTLLYMEGKIALKKLLLKRYDVQDCDYPALTEEQMAAYKKFHAFIKESLIGNKPPVVPSSVSATVSPTLMACAAEKASREEVEQKL